MGWSYGRMVAPPSAAIVAYVCPRSVPSPSFSMRPLFLFCSSPSPPFRFFIDPLLFFFGLGGANFARPTDTEAKGGKGAKLAIMVQSDLSALVEKELEEKRERTNAQAQEHGPYLKRRNTPVVDRKSTLTVPNLENREEEEERTTRGYYAGVGTCASGIIGTLVCYGILQERIMTRPYGERIPNTHTDVSKPRERIFHGLTMDGPRFFGFERKWAGRVLQALPAHCVREPDADMPRGAGDERGQGPAHPADRPALLLRLDLLVQRRRHVLPVRGPQVSPLPPAPCIPPPANQPPLTSSSPLHSR